MYKEKTILTCKNLVISNANRIMELLEDMPDERLHFQFIDHELTELKVKMAELRRDTIRLEKLIYGRSI